MKKVFLSVVIIIILVPLFLMNTKKDYYSEVDNRNLAQINENNDVDSFVDNLYEYTDDRIGLREQMLFLYHNFNFHVLNYSSHPDYEFGKNGELFPSIADNQDYDEYKQTFTQTIIKLNEYCKSHGIAFYVMFNPNKISIYKENIPSGINYDNEWVSMMLNELKDNEVKVADNYNYFLSIKDENIYNSLDDVTHWNDYGALKGCNNLLALIKEDFPDVETNDLEISTMIKKYIDNTNIIINEEIPTIKMEPNMIESPDRTKEREALSTDYTFANYVHKITNSSYNSSKPKVLAFEGSYLFGRDHQALISNQCREFVGIHNYRNILNLPYYVNIFKPEIVIFDIAEFVIADYFFPLETMLNIDYPDGLNVHEYQYVKTEIANLNTNIFNDVYLELFFNCSNDKQAYLIVEDTYYDLTNKEDCYYLYTLKANIDNNTNCRLVVVNEVNEQFLYQDFMITYN